MREPIRRTDRGLTAPSRRVVASARLQPLVSAPSLTVLRRQTTTASAFGSRLSRSRPGRRLPRRRDSDHAAGQLRTVPRIGRGQRRRRHRLRRPGRRQRRVHRPRKVRRGRHRRTTLRIRQCRPGLRSARRPRHARRGTQTIVAFAIIRPLDSKRLTSNGAKPRYREPCLKRVANATITVQAFEDC